MTTPTPAQTKVLSARLMTNIVTAPNMLTVKFVGVLTLLWGAWSSLPEATQQELIAGLNIPTKWLPYLAALGVIIARVWPQLNMPAPPAEPPTLTEVVPDSIPIADTAALDAEWAEALKTVYPKMTDEQLDRLLKVRALVRSKSVLQPHERLIP